MHMVLMKIVLIGNYTADGQQSMSRYAVLLHRELTKRGHSVDLITPTVCVRHLLPQRHRLAKWLGYADKYLLFRLNFARRIRNADLVHVCDHSNSPYLVWCKRKPKIITCHDAFGIRSALGHYVQNPTRASGRWLQRWILNSLSYADRIVYVSEKTREDFTHVLSINVPSDVILHALNWSYGPCTGDELERALALLGLKAGAYLLHVGGNQWYKNRLGVLRAFQEIKKHDRYSRLKLVMAGKPFTSAMKVWMQQQSLSDVIELTEISNEQLQVLYSGAMALLFPSLEEGFGWPLLEAQACNCPVITSNRAPMTQIAGTGAVYLNPERPETAVAALDAITAHRDELISAGRENLRRFTADEMISRYEAAYEKVLRDCGARVE